MPRKTPKKQIKKQLIEDLEKALGDKREILEDVIIEKDYVEIPIELSNSPDFDTIEDILKRYGYVLSHITRNTVVFTKPRKKLPWEIQEFIEYMSILANR